MSIILCISVLYGCAPKDNVIDNKEQIKQEKAAIKTTPIVTDYNVGIGEIPQRRFEPIKYEVSGVIGVPEESGQYPLVMILHGNHRFDNVNDATKSRGFTYLVEELASNGYVAMSINATAVHYMNNGVKNEGIEEPDGYERLKPIVDFQLDYLSKAVNGGSVDYGVNLKNKVDMDNINLIGHSRGGENLFYIYENLKQQDEAHKIKSILAIEPTNMFIRDWKVADVPTAIVLGEVDGDVTSQDGEAIYSEIIENNNRKSIAHIVYLYGANHSFFNDNLERDDALIIEENKDNITQLEKANQQEFLEKYAIDFINLVNDRKTNELDFKFDNESHDKIYGYEVSSRSFVPEYLELIDLEYELGDKVFNESMGFSQTNVVVNNTAFEIETNGAEVSYVIDTPMAIYPNTSGLFNTIGGAIKIKPLTNIIWKDKNAKVSIDTDKVDFTSYNTLVLEAAMDSSSSYNGDATSFHLVLEDSKGKTSKVKLDDRFRGLRKLKGSVIESMYGDYWSRPVAFSSITIPLEKFEGVDISKVSKASFVFDENNTGSIFINKFFLIKN